MALSCKRGHPTQDSVIDCVDKSPLLTYETGPLDRIQARNCHSRMQFSGNPVTVC